MIPEDLSAREILDIAIVADKYDFVDALEMANDPGFVLARKRKQKIWLFWLQHMYFEMRNFSNGLLRLSL